tara:strand:+ start:661 stop:1872 length:1212 start_codon:yes stop_codon:yes gene_type:complete
MGIYFGNMIRIKNYPNFRILPNNLDKIIEKKPTIIVIIIMILEISYLTVLISSIDNFWEKINKLIQLDFYSLRYELIDNAYKSTRDAGDKSISSLLKNLDRFVLIAYSAINAYFINSKRNATRDRLIFIPLFLIFIGLTVIKGSRTGFVISILSFVIGLSYGNSIKEQNTEDGYIKNEMNLLKRSKKKKRNFKLIIIAIITISLLIVGKITNDRVGRMDIKNDWLGRYVKNMGASTKYCNKLCNNPVIAGASGYTISPFLYSKKEFDKQLENSGISEGFGLGYKSFWFPHQVLMRIPIIKKITYDNKDNWLKNLEYNHPRNRLRKSSWRGLIHDYIFDWGIYFGPIAIFFSYSFVGYLEGLSKRSKGLKSLICSIISILFSVLSIAIQPFNILFPLAIFAIIL